MEIALYIIGGLIVLIAGGELTVKGAVNLANKFNVPKAVIGLTIVAYATSLPEGVVTFKASLDNLYDLAIGNIIGSNISNILLIMGAALIIKPYTEGFKFTKFEAAIVLISTISFVVFGYLFNVGLYASLIFTAIALYYSKNLWGQIKNNPPEDASGDDISLTYTIAYLVLGFAGLKFGADYLIDGSVQLATMFGIPQAIIGVTIIALGSSLPELATAVSSARNNHTDLALANILGSCFVNIVGVLGITGYFVNIPVNRMFFEFDIWYMLAATIALCGLLIVKNKIGRTAGICFIIAYFAYIAKQVAEVL